MNFETASEKIRSKFKYILICGGIFLIITFFLNLVIHISTSSFMFSADNYHPSKSVVAVVLGTTPRTVGGYQNTYFDQRINGAVSLYKSGLVSKILVSGDNTTIYYNEPKAMRQALFQAGVPHENIFEDFGGRDTYDSVLRSRDIFGIDNPIFITQNFHAERALFIARWNNISAIAYVVPGSSNPLIIAKQYIREYFARLKMFYELLTSREVSIKGNYEPI